MRRIRVAAPIDSKWYKAANTATHQDWQRVRPLELNQPIDGWEPIDLKFRDPLDRPSLECTMPEFGNGALLCFRDDVIGAARELVGGFGEFYPCNSPLGVHHIFSCTVVLDALDRERSRIRYYESGRIAMVNRYALIAERITNKIFRLKGSAAMYVTDELIAEFAAAGIYGTAWEIVWDSDLDVQPERFTGQPLIDPPPPGTMG